MQHVKGDSSSVRRVVSLSSWKGTLALAVLAACSSSKPPPDFAPDPGLVAQIREIRIHPRTEWACPGQTITTDYDAVLANGSILPFARSYDEDNPPALHVVFLRRTSPSAQSQQDGDWSANPDPLVSALDGFRLEVAVVARPELTASVVIAPEYSCLPHTFRFVGRAGSRGQAGLSGPDVLVRLNELRSPFYPRLLVMAVEVGEAPPFFLLQDAEAVPPSDWLVIRSEGGRGGRGVEGVVGAPGARGADGCPGAQGGPGGAGGAGGPGAPGGPGGPITIVAPAEEPFLAGLVEGQSVGGRGGPGGGGGKGGPGGEGGTGLVTAGRRCASGEAGPQGEEGPQGPEGAVGRGGPRARVLTVSGSDVFGARVPFVLQALLDYARQ